jgi:excisionase family DNA binding protein
MRTSTHLLTIREAAGALRLHPSTVRRLVENGEIPGLKVGGQYRLNIAHIEQRLAEPATAA